MYAGSEAACEVVEPVLAGLSDRRRRVGDRPGMAQALKLANNFLSATALAATSEAVAFGLSVGLDMGTMLEVLNASSGQSEATRDKFPNHVYTGRYASGFANSLMSKDVTLYLNAVEAQGAPSAIGRVTASVSGALRGDRSRCRLHPHLPLRPGVMTVESDSFRGTARTGYAATMTSREPVSPHTHRPHGPMTLITESHDGVLVATIDDGKANALSFELVDSLRAAVASAGGQGHALVITGRDGCFSAGFDLAVMNGDDQDRASALFAEGARLYREIVEAPVPVVASCTGHALAGGAILLLCADYRIGRAGSYKVGLNEVGIGMALPAFAVSIATHRLEPRFLTSAAMFAEVVAPDRAMAMGYLDEVVDDPLPGALSLASSLAQLPHEAFAATKRRIRRGLTQELTALEGG